MSRYYQSQCFCACRFKHHYVDKFHSCTVRLDIIKVFYLLTHNRVVLRHSFFDYFNNYNFSKAQIIRALMTVIEPKHVGAVLM